MNIFKQIIDSIAYANLFGIISMLIFFAVFGGVIYWVIRLDKRFVEHMSELPLDQSRGNAGKDSHV
jgi:cytochrome c oxidase cbb3-type subunit IV